MKLMPLMTEKTMSLAKNGGFTFLLSKELTKPQIKKLISETFGVNVINVKTVTFKGGTKKNMRGQVQRIKSYKKAIVTLKEGEKIDLFEEEKKKFKKPPKES